MSTRKVRLALVAVACGLVFTNPVVAQTGADEAKAKKTLQTIKAEGALRSSYREHQPVMIGDAAPEPKLESFRKDIGPALTEACIACHGPDTQEANFRIDKLDPDLLHGDDVKWWIEVVDVLSKGEMPPKDADEIADSDRALIIDWLSSELQVASAVRRSEEGHSSFRRMSRYEFNYALQDLLGLPFDFGKDLPPEPSSEDGFQNSSEVLQMSSMQFEAYRAAARAALLRATVRGERPKPIYWGASMESASAKTWKRQAADLEKKKERFKDDPKKLQRELDKLKRKINRRGAHFLHKETDQAVRMSWGYNGARYAWPPIDTKPTAPESSPLVAVLPAGQRMTVELGNTIPDTGTLRIRVRAVRTSTEENQIPILCWEFGWQASNNSSASEPVGGADVAIASDTPQFYQWDIPLGEINVRNPMRKTAEMGKTPSPSELFRLKNVSGTQSEVQIDYVEVTAPVYEQWPPQSHTNIFIDSPDKSDESKYALEVLTSFMTRAWRRDVTEEEVAQKLELFETIRPQCDDAQQATIEVLATVLASSKFLYLLNAPDSSGAQNENSVGELTSHELATRLAIFLWCSTPDQQLIELAANGRLNDPAVLEAQTKRMLADPRSKRFSKHFVRQWLGMQLLDFLKVDKKFYSQFDTELKTAMQQEPIAFFHEVLQNNHSVMDLIHADYTMANRRLARHYGRDDVFGSHFRRVTLSDDDQRGGLLTQAGLLAMNSDGKDSHPLKRGIWLLEKILNDPPPPPPPAVPEIDLADPEIAKLTLKQRIENHRNDAACMSCHAKIDPWGIAFENFDAVGRWRTTVKGEPVDANSLLFNKQELDGMDGLKQFLLANRQDQFARAMVHKLTTYALGRPLTFADRSDVDAITAKLRAKKDGLGDLISLIVVSELFRSR